MDTITATNNRLVKKAISLKQKKYRDAENAFLLEGTRSVETALAAAAPFEYCFFTEAFAHNARNSQLLEQLQAKVKCFAVPETLFAKMAETETPQGILAVVHKSEAALATLTLSDAATATVVIFDGLQDPGNVGTILRTADSMGVSALIALKGTADLFAPKTVRATMGSLFHLPIIEKVTPAELADFAAQNKLTLFAAMVDQKAQPIYQCNFRQRCGIILGNEGNGISSEVQAIAQQKFFIPMLGQAESLNAASAAAMIFYEALRQKSSQ